MDEERDVGNIFLSLQKVSGLMQIPLPNLVPENAVGKHFANENGLDMISTTQSSLNKSICTDFGL